MSAEKMATQFAPAERDSQQEVQKQSSGLLAVTMLRQLVNAMPDILLILNDKRQIIFANQRLLDFLSCKDPKEIYGARPGELLQCVRSDETEGGCGTTEACRHCGMVLAILSSQEGKGGERECRIARKDREGLNLRVNATPFELEGRGYTIISVADISAEKRQKVLGRVLFQGILGGARDMRAEAAELREADADQLQLFRGKTFRFSDTLIEEVNEHRILTAAEKGELHVQPVGVSTREVLKQVIQFYEKHPEAQGKSIEIGRQSVNEMFVTDQTLLKQVLGYMIINALEECQQNERVTLNADLTGEVIELSVFNPGHIPREAQLQIFQRGFTTKGEGRGVGTYAMKLLSEKYLKGKVSFSSTSRVGTTFRVILPQQI